MNFTLPTPEEVGFNSVTYYQTLKARIKSAIEGKTFEFVPDPHWKFAEIENEINKEINPFGWKLIDDYHGSFEGGRYIWKLIPNR